MHSRNELLNLKEGHNFSSSENPEKRKLINIDKNPDIPHCSNTGLQCLDQVVENIILDKNEKFIASGSQSIIRDTYFKQGSHFGMKIDPFKYKKLNYQESDISDITRKEVNTYGEIRENVDNTVSLATQLLDQPPRINNSSKNNKLEELFSQQGNFGNVDINNLSMKYNKPVFNSPKLNANPYTYLSTEKINPLQQLSPVFNDEKSQENQEIVDMISQNESIAKTDVLDQSEVINVIEDSPEFNINGVGFINEIKPHKNVISDSRDIESSAPGHVHVMSSSCKKVESFISEMGQTIDGAAFNSIKKLHKRKDKSNLKNSKINKRKLKPSWINGMKPLKVQKTYGTKSNQMEPKSSDIEETSKQNRINKDPSSTSDGKSDMTIIKPSNRYFKELHANTKLNKKNEILYLDFGGKLITLAGSLNKKKPLNTDWSKARVVLPNDVDIKRKKGQKAIFSSSALQSHEQPIFSLHSINLLKDNIMNTVEDITPKANKIANDHTNESNVINKENVCKVEIKRNNANILTNNNKLENISAFKSKVNKLSTNNSEVSSSEMKCTRDDVIKSTVDSTITQMSPSSKNNIYHLPSISREMKSLNRNIISDGEVIQEENSSCVNETDTCYKESYCKLGCICDSLQQEKIVRNHCQRIECMLECTCQIGDLGQKGLACREKDFQNGSDIFSVEENNKRDSQLPERSKNSEKSMTLPSIECPADTTTEPVSHVLPEDYYKYVEGFKLELPWYTLPETVSVWCMFHNVYDCKCLLNGKYSNNCQDSFDRPNSNHEMSDDVKKRIEIDAKFSEIICQKLVKCNQNSKLENNGSYNFKYWIHNGKHHCARTCGYNMKNMQFETIQKMPQHHLASAKPLIMGMTTSFSNNLPMEIKTKSSPHKKTSVNQLDYTNNIKTENILSSNDLELKNKNESSTKKRANNFEDKNYHRHNPESVDGSRISLHWMIKEEEKRGELELDLIANIPGRMIIVSEPRFKKLINMCIIGIVGLSHDHRCIISTVNSTKDLVKMRKIQQLIMNNTVDVGPHMKGIFCKETGNEYKYVMIRCDSIGRWEIFGVVQKKQNKMESSLPFKKKNPSKCSTTSISNEMNYFNTSEVNQLRVSTASQDNKSTVINNSQTYNVATTKITESEQTDVANISKTLKNEKYFNDFKNENDNLPSITDVIGGIDLANSLMAKDNNFCERIEEHNSLLQVENQKLSNVVQSFHINPTSNKILNHYKGNLYSEGLDSVCSNEQYINIQSPLKETTSNIILAQTSDNTKLIYVPAASNNKPRLVVVPVESESSNILIFPNNSSFASTLNSTTVKRKNPYLNEICNHISKKPNLFQPLILAENQSLDIPLQENQPIKNVLPLNSTIDNQHSRKDGENAKNLASNILPNKLDQSKLSLESSSLQTEEVSQQITSSDETVSSNVNDAENAECDHLDTLILDDALSCPPQLDNNLDIDRDCVVNSIDDLSLKLETSCNDIESDHGCHDKEDDIPDMISIPEKFKEDEFEKNSLPIQIRNPPEILTKTPALETKEQVANSRELIYVPDVTSTPVKFTEGEITQNCLPIQVKKLPEILAKTPALKTKVQVANNRQLIYVPDVTSTPVKFTEGEITQNSLPIQVRKSTEILTKTPALETKVQVVNSRQLIYVPDVTSNPVKFREGEIKKNSLPIQIRKLPKILPKTPELKTKVQVANSRQLIYVPDVISTHVKFTESEIKKNSLPIQIRKLPEILAKTPASKTKVQVANSRQLIYVPDVTSTPVKFREGEVTQNSLPIQVRKSPEILVKTPALETKVQVVNSRQLIYVPDVTSTPVKFREGEIKQNSLHIQIRKSPEILTKTPALETKVQVANSRELICVPDVTSTPVKFREDEIEQNSLPIQIRESPEILTKTPALETKVQVTNSPELIYIESQKLENCSCIDMSIRFKSVKLHWIPGTISKVVLDTIAIQSKKHCVPISLVVEISGKKVKFYGKNCYLSGHMKIPILILGTNLLLVKQKCKQDISKFYTSNLVKYVIPLKNDQLCTFTYDKSGLNLIRLQNIVRSMAGFDDFSSMKIPVDLLRNPLIYNSREMNLPTYNDSYNKSMVPFRFYKPAIKSMANKSSTSNLQCSSKPTKRVISELSLKRKISTSNYINLKKQKVSCNIGIPANLRNIETTPVGSRSPKHVKEIETKESSSDIASRIEKPIDLCIEESPSNPYQINLSNKLECVNRKEFGSIACYDDILLKNTDMSINETNIEPTMKSKAEKNSINSTKLKSSRKKCLSLSNLRDCDTANESFNNSSFCSALRRKSLSDSNLTDCNTENESFKESFCSVLGKKSLLHSNLKDCDAKNASLKGSSSCSDITNGHSLSDASTTNSRTDSNIHESENEHRNPQKSLPTQSDLIEIPIPKKRHKWSDQDKDTLRKAFSSFVYGHSSYYIKGSAIDKFIMNNPLYLHNLPTKIKKTKTREKLNYMRKAVLRERTNFNDIYMI